jgi:hypothetical protein
MRGARIGGEPSIDRRLDLVKSFWHHARLLTMAKKLKRVPVSPRAVIADDFGGRRRS